jgi:hypothetical protein
MEPTIEDLVVAALNTVYDSLKLHGLDPNFIDRVTDAAREWAEDCYQD